MEHFVDGPFDLELFLHDSHHAIGCNGRVNLDSNGILRLTPELFYLKMLLHPLEKEFDLPSVLVQQSNRYRFEIQCVGEEDKLPLLLLVPVYDSTDLVWILFHGLLPVHISDAVGDDAGALGETPAPFHGFEVIVLLAPDDEVSTDSLDIMQPFEVIVSAIKDVEGVLFVWDDVHCIHVIDLSWRNMEEGRDLSLNVILCMNLNASLPLLFPVERPFECFQAKFNGRRVKGVDLTTESEDVSRTAFLGPCYRSVRILLKDTIVPVGVGFGQVALCGSLPETEVIGLRSMGLSREDYVTKTLSIRKLTKHQNGELVPA